MSTSRINPPAPGKSTTAASKGVISAAARGWFLAINGGQTIACGCNSTKPLIQLPLARFRNWLKDSPASRPSINSRRNSRRNRRSVLSRRTSLTGAPPCAWPSRSCVSSAPPPRATEPALASTPILPGARVRRHVGRPRFERCQRLRSRILAFPVRASPGCPYVGVRRRFEGEARLLTGTFGHRFGCVSLTRPPP
jgi:hypothetical protein